MVNRRGGIRKGYVRRTRSGYRCVRPTIVRSSSGLGRTGIFGWFR